jgi:tRNA threonylcarbamoyladenosine biosynthesis protein TsaB
MTYLVLDTSTDQCLIALAQENRVIAETIFTHGNQLSSSLLPSIQMLVESHIQSPKNLRGIAPGIGPGSYTGTRVGVAVAKSLAFALGIPVIPFCSPLAFLPHREGTFAFFIPARSGQCYVLSGNISETSVIQHEARLCPAEELEQFQTADMLICASPDMAFKKKCDLPTPNIPFLCRYLSGQEPTSPEDVELHYLR